MRDSVIFTFPLENAAPAFSFGFFRTSPNKDLHLLF